MEREEDRSSFPGWWDYTLEPVLEESEGRSQKNRSFVL